MEDLLKSFISSSNKPSKMRGGRPVYEVTPGIDGLLREWKKQEHDEKGKRTRVKEGEILCEILVITAYPFSMKFFPVRSPADGLLYIDLFALEGAEVKADQVIAEIVSEYVKI